MKTLALLIALSLVACVTDDTTPPADNGVAYPYCGLTLAPPVPYGGDIIGGPCQLAVTVDVFCPEGTDPTLDRLLVAWYTTDASGIVETTYRCNATTVIKFGDAVCTGQPITAVANFQDPFTGEFQAAEGSEGERLCADKVVAL